MSCLDFLDQHVLVPSRSKFQSEYRFVRSQLLLYPDIVPVLLLTSLRAVPLYMLICLRIHAFLIGCVCLLLLLSVLHLILYLTLSLYRFVKQLHGCLFLFLV